MALSLSAVLRDPLGTLRRWWLILAGAEGAWRALLAMVLLTAVLVPLGFGGLLVLVVLVTALGIVPGPLLSWSRFSWSFGPAVIGAALAGILVYPALGAWLKGWRLLAAILVAGLSFVFIGGLWFLLDVLTE